MSGTSISYSHGIVETDPIDADTTAIITTTTTTTTTTTISSNNINSNTEKVKFYEAIIFSGPIVFTLIVLFLFYFFYLRHHSVDWSSLRMRASNLASHHTEVIEVGLKKEFREMLPVIIYKESFFVKDTQCSVCLGDYQADDKLQQIPGCGHTFHLNCIDNWLTTHTTCPLCRLSVISSSTTPASEPDTHNRTSTRLTNSESGDNFGQQSQLPV